MKEQELQALVAAAISDADLTGKEIPAIDLYLDQILSLVAEKNKAASPRYRERALTKTMVNNYSKDGLISPITGKKYSYEHIVEILLVYGMKNSLSIGEIKRVLFGVREDCGFDGEVLSRCYDRFLALKDKNRQRVGSLVESVLAEDGLDPQSDEELFLAVLDMLSLSAYLKAVAQEILEARYTDPDEAEKENKQREKAEKKAKTEAEKQQKREDAVREKAERAEKKAEKAEKKADKVEKKKKTAETETMQ